MSSEETKSQISEKMKTLLLATEVDVIDESWKHAGHASAGGGGHFIVHLVSEKFEGVSLLDRNRMVFDALKEEMQADIHALVIRAQTPAETKQS